MSACLVVVVAVTQAAAVEDGRVVQEGVSVDVLGLLEPSKEAVCEDLTLPGLNDGQLVEDLRIVIVVSPREMATHCLQIRSVFRSAMPGTIGRMPEEAKPP